MSNFTRTVASPFDDFAVIISCSIGASVVTLCIASAIMKRKWGRREREFQTTTSELIEESLSSEDVNFPSFVPNSIHHFLCSFKFFSTEAWLHSAFSLNSFRECLPKNPRNFSKGHLQTNTKGMRCFPDQVN
jgi:hypothetical protein